MTEVRNLPSREQLAIAEIGAGTGTMIDRLREWEFFSQVLGGKRVSYDAWETNEATAAFLEKRLVSAPEIASARVHREDVRHTKVDRRFDLVIAHAVLDLFDPADCVATIQSLTAPGALIYGSIVFDGATSFEPEFGADEEVVRLYHASMRGGFARRQLTALHNAGFSISAVGASDWVIPPRRDGASSADTVVLSTVLDMFESAVGSQIEDGATLARADLDRWLADRRKRARAGSLLFIAHQLDFVVRR